LDSRLRGNDEGEFMLFKSKKPHFEYLRQKWTGKHKALHEKLFDKHKEVGRQLAISGIGSLMLLTTPAVGLLPAGKLTASGQIDSDIDRNALLSAELADKVPTQMQALTTDEEAQIGELLSNRFGFKVSAELENKKLNRSYGMIGGEQHLYRYPGDTLQAHSQNATDWAMYGGSGIAPGLGAWGHFAPSKQQFTKKDEERERYYLAVQTFLSPGYAERLKEYRDFFRFRKMLVVNPKTGQAVVAVIGDAGPAAWTGKHLGGSPEVMQAVGLAGGPRKGAVLYFFIDDPEDKIPLGPVKVNGNTNG